MKEFLKSLSLAVIIFLAELLDSTISKISLVGGSEVEESVLDVPVQVTIWAIGIIAFFFACRIIDRNHIWLLNNRWYRRRHITPAEYEGYWFGHASVNGEDENLISFSKIYYDRDEQCWIHQGNQFDNDLKRTRSWRNKSVHYAKRKHLWFFTGNFWPFDPERAPATTGEFPQFSIIEVPKKGKQGPTVSRFYDEFMSVGSRIITTGAAQMYRIPQSEIGKISIICNKHITRIEDFDEEIVEDCILHLESIGLLKELPN